jgi:hypothetical protein
LCGLIRSSFSNAITNSITNAIWLSEEGRSMVKQLHPKRLITLARALLLTSCAGLSTSSLLPAAESALPAADLPLFKYVFVIVMENKEYDQVIGSPDAPYVNALAQHYGLATNYYGIRHPSLPNYLALTGGSTFDITSNCTDCVIAQPNLVDQLEAAGKSWKAYIESMPSPCYIGDTPPLYQQKHNPLTIMRACAAIPSAAIRLCPFRSSHLMPAVTCCLTMCGSRRICATIATIAQSAPAIAGSRHGCRLFSTHRNGKTMACYSSPTARAIARKY